MFSGAKQHSSDRHITALRNESRTTWFITISPLQFPTSENSFKLSIPIIGSARWKSPVKTLPELLGTNWRINLITPRPRRVRVLPSLNRRTRTCLPARPQQRKHLRIQEVESRPIIQARERQQAHPSGKAMPSRQKPLSLLRCVRTYG